MNLYDILLAKKLGGSSGGGGSSDFTTCKLTITNVAGNADLYAPVYYVDPQEGKVIVSVAEGAAGHTWDIVIPVDSVNMISIRPTTGSTAVEIVSGEISSLDATTFLLSGDAEVSIVSDR